jgi:hypothetical protein
MKKIARMFLVDDDATINNSLLFGGAASLMAVLMLSRLIRIDFFPLLGLLALVGFVAGLRGLKSEKKKQCYWGIGLSITPLVLLVFGFLSVVGGMRDLH